MSEYARPKRTRTSPTECIAATRAAETFYAKPHPLDKVAPSMNQLPTGNVGLRTFGRRLMASVRTTNRLKLMTLAPALAAVAACTSYPKLQAGTVSGNPTENTNQTAESADTQDNPSQTRIERVIQPSVSLSAQSSGKPVSAQTAQDAQAQIDALLSDEKIEATLPPQAVAEFVDTVFGQILGVPYSTGPGVAERKEIVSLRGTVAISKRKFFVMAQAALRDYGLAVTIENGVVRVLADEALAGQAPLFVRARALPTTPEASRPVLQFFELQSIDVNSLVELLKDAYPNAGKVKFTPRQDINTLVISGNAREVAAVAEVIDQIDRPRFAGAEVARVEPIYWSADRLAEAVAQVLNTEGFQAARGGGTIQRAVTFLPVPFTNQVSLFSNQKEAFERALYWIRELDRPAALGDQESVFIYTVQNTSAAELGQLVAQLSGGGAAVGPAQTRVPAGGRRQDAQTAVPGTAPQANGPATAAGPVRNGRITVDSVGNRLLFSGTPSEFERTRDLMEQLDTPPQQVLVELTIAEVTLTDETRFGVEWFITEAVGQGLISGGTLGGLGLAAGGLDIAATQLFNNTEVRAALNAFASNNNVNILSTPRLVARSGGEAQIQVGTDVPIITSQRALDVQTGGDSDVLQTVQYRQTGVILNVRPIVYGDDRVDIEIFQEVSSQQANPNAAVSSPLILNRSVTTQLALREGMTAVIGGLIQDNYSRGQTGIPILKDLPLIGGAFRTDTVAGNKTELLILITPYIVRSDEELSNAAEAYSGSINKLLRSRGPHGYTLLPWSTGFRPKRVHGVDGPFERSEAPLAPAREEQSSVVQPTAAGTRQAFTAPLVPQQDFPILAPIPDTVLLAVPPAVDTPSFADASPRLSLPDDPNPTPEPTAATASPPSALEAAAEMLRATVATKGLSAEALARLEAALAVLGAPATPQKPVEYSLSARLVGQATNTAGEIPLATIAAN